MNAAGRCDGLEHEHAEDVHTIYPIEDLLAAEYFDDARRNAELFLQTCIGTSNTQNGRWNLDGCTLKVRNGFLLVGGISVMQSDGKGGSIIPLCLKYGLNVYADCRKVRGVDARIQRGTFSIVVPVSFFDEVVANSVFIVFDDELNGFWGSETAVGDCEVSGLTEQISTGSLDASDCG